MFKSLYFKIVLILVIFIITVMCIIGTIMINSVYSFYNSEFLSQMSENFDKDSLLYQELENTLSKTSYASEQKAILNSYSAMLGIDDYRNYYILDMTGNMMTGSDTELGRTLIITPNMISAMNKKTGDRQIMGAEYADYAFYLGNGESECIIYIKDSMEEMRQLSWMLFSIILQALFFGLVIAILLSFFLAKAITSPIQNLTYGVQLVSAGEFSYEIDVHSRDEIGILTDNFNHMKDVLNSTLNQVSGERQKLELVLSYLQDAVVAFTDTGKLLHANASAGDLFGSSFSANFTFEQMLELMDMIFDVQMLDPKSDYDSGEVERTGDGGVIFHDKVFNNRVLDVNLGAMKYTADGKNKVGIIAVIHDVTNRYELDKSRREFVANVSHELRTPLTSIKGACETIREDAEMPREMQEYFLDMAVTESDRMTRIVSDLLVLSRLDNKRTQWEISTFDIRESVRRLCEVMRVDLESHGHSISFNASKVMSSITGDKERIEQVLINIISNAIKYTPDNGNITINAVQRGDFVAVSVTDNGVGIPEEDIPHLFERFYRVEKSRTTETGGTGLGLAIAKEIIAAHGGDIEVVSAYGKGTTMTVVLPVVSKLK